MTKRTSYKNFKRRYQDAYMTHDLDPIIRLGEVLKVKPFIRQFIDPCCGDGICTKNIENITGLHCLEMSDIGMSMDLVLNKDVRHIPFSIKDATSQAKKSNDYIVYITNPPWTRSILHKIIDHLMFTGCDFWLLFDADWLHTIQAEKYLIYCHTIISAGRVSWMNNGIKGLDNVCWYGFNGESSFRTKINGLKKMKKNRKIDAKMFRASQTRRELTREEIAEKIASIKGLKQSTILRWFGKGGVPYKHVKGLRGIMDKIEKDYYGDNNIDLLHKECIDGVP